jgi:hypothetical protein
LRSLERAKAQRTGEKVMRRQFAAGMLSRNMQQVRKPLQKAGPTWGGNPAHSSITAMSERRAIAPHFVRCIKSRGWPTLRPASPSAPAP